MRDPNRLLRLYPDLALYHKKYFPDWRFGQFVENLFSWIKENGRDPFYIEDDNMIDWVRSYIESCGMEV